MIAYLAAYDIGYSSPTGDYWIWKHRRLPTKLLHDCYSALAKSHLPENPNLLMKDDLHGGCLSQDSDWCCFYRFFDGGLELSGRPGRFVMLCAFVEREVITGLDCSGLLETDPFSTWAGKQPFQGTPPEPECLEYDFACGLLNQTAMAVKTDRGRPRTFSGPTALAESWTLCARLDVSDSFHWRVSRTDGRTKADVQVSVPHASATQFVENEAIAKPSRTSPPTSTRRPDPVVGRTQPQNLHLPSPQRTLLKLPMAVVLSAFVGCVGGFLLSRWGPLASANHTSSDVVSKQVLLEWLEQYHSDEDGKRIHKEELLRRLRNDDWTPFKDQSQPADSRRSGIEFRSGRRRPEIETQDILPEPSGRPDRNPHLPFP